MSVAALDHAAEAAGGLLEELPGGPAARASGRGMRLLKGLGSAAACLALLAAVRGGGAARAARPAPLEAGGEALRGGVLGLAGERALAPAPPGRQAGNTLFCFMAVLPGSSEAKLKLKAYQSHGGVYGLNCNFQKVYDSLPAPFVHQGTWNSFANTASFIKVWEQVFADKLWERAEWTVKVDPDTVFSAARLKVHLAALRPPAGAAVYIKNCAISFGFLGPIELMSREGVRAFEKGHQDCARKLGNQWQGEDGFVKVCLDAIGVGVMSDPDMLQTWGDCWESNKVAFHAHKDPDDWFKCLMRIGR